MESEGERYRSYSRRTALIAGLQLTAAGVLGGRMYYLGVVEADKYQTRADDNRLSLRLIAPERGEILDRFGRPLANNRQDFRVFLIPEETEDVAATLDRMAGIFSISDSRRSRIERQISRQRSFFPVTIAENLSWEEFAQLNVESPDLSGVYPDAGRTRAYPLAEIVAPVVGYVGPVSDADAGDDKVLQIPGFRIGKEGLERTLDLTLRGAAGTRRVEVNAFGRIIREVARQESTTGVDQALTIDLDLQDFAARRLGEESAAVIVMDVQTGEIRTLVSTPSYDPNAFNIGISRENWQGLLNDPRRPLVNKAIQGAYPPGSTIKMMVALAALEDGTIPPEDTVFCNSRYPYGDRVWHCWKRGGHGQVDLVGSMKHSCDVYYYDVSRRIGFERIARMMKRFGLGETHDLGIPGAVAGIVPDPQWKRDALGQPWVGGDTLNAAIGQGFVLTTPVHLALMTARLASGKVIKPTLVSHKGPASEVPDLNIPEAHLDLARQGMIGVMSQGGTAYGSRLTGDGRSMAGKTGTAQVRRITKAERDAGDVKTDKKPWVEREHAIFVGYGPIDAPRYAVAVLVEHGGGGSKVAAPIARDILGQALDLDRQRGESVATGTGSTEPTTDPSAPGGGH